MSGAFLALWNDYPAGLTDEYEAWHTFEHVPERLTAPGMISARRYGLFGQAENRYFTFYALEDLQALQQPAYLDLVRNPTEWSFKMRTHFLNVLRIPAQEMASGGHGRGGGMIVQAYSIARDSAQTTTPELAAALNAMRGEGKLLGYRLGLAEPNQPYEVFEQTDLTDPDTLNLVVLVDGTSVPMLQDIQPAIRQAVETRLHPRTCLRDDIFHFLVEYDHREFPRTRAHLQAKPDLKRRFA